ncbi:MAG: 30S ribosomal protein S17 [Parcubacteria group bacterium]|jgi:small subunit ribosomal protein S17|nr:30S ribosomal protein S17 [Parcubacteria group bacterium]|tara:strand:- start:20504 stop:20764 length:261 start_codon:yes stop_codon:yes gene_type:complete
MTTEDKKDHKKVTKRKFEGIVASDKGDKTIIVEVRRTKIHSKYLKRFIVSKKYAVHDPANKYKVGDKVSFVETRPISKNKRWIVIN